MIRKNQRLFNFLNVLTDAVLVFLAMPLACAVRFGVFHGVLSVPLTVYLLLGGAAAALSVSALALGGLYRSYRSVGFYREAAQLLNAGLFDTPALLAALFVFHLDDVSRWALVLFFFFSSGLLLIKRAAARTLLRRLRRKGFNQKHVVLVGCGPAARAYLDRIRANPEFGFQVDGYVADRSELSPLPWLGPYEKLEAVLDAAAPDEAVLAVPAEDEAALSRLVADCERTGTRLSLIPCCVEFISAHPEVDALDGLPMINLRRIPLDQPGWALAKRLFDLVGAALLLIPALPVMAAAAVGVRLSSPGPVLFRQERVGRSRRPFFMYKLRSMVVNEGADTTWSTAADGRQTRFGAWMRRHSIDELPQLFNVLRGEMSLVGPRPEVPYFVEQFRREIPRYMVKHQVRPGMTGWAQVNGLRGDTSVPRRIEYDLFYIENWSVLLDLKILFMTLFHLSDG